MLFLNDIFLNHLDLLSQKQESDFFDRSTKKLNYEHVLRQIYVPIARLQIYAMLGEKVEIPTIVKTGLSDFEQTWQEVQMEEWFANGTEGEFEIVDFKGNVIAKAVMSDDNKPQITECKQDTVMENENLLPPSASLTTSAIVGYNSPSTNNL